ncbi:uncharacterized protein K460DRAFT_57095 [Cucurbitaria berberidis CBS 394.84]|uniref:Uncharacterized protein n=1 Tax=Cucurbitaria berberidis CBS 394.84 TaxID=1168544 RepID=A0A9P4GLE9_9PLEO|nr:uncharacterized protein K460DRAFT_57095 [Cucurbitaria berberidis CBS 394.84]KAF1847344.1 hypothetical protein K460DRAFT_57095 [Cucurbitaria berberidis CBS 394.84]
MEPEPQLDPVVESSPNHKQKTTRQKRTHGACSLLQRRRACGTIYLLLVRDEVRTVCAACCHYPPAPTPVPVPTPASAPPAPPAASVRHQNLLLHVMRRHSAYRRKSLQTAAGG